jgi:methionyl aminopeptidase
MPIIIKSPADIEKMAASGQLVARVHQKMSEAIAPGITTAELDTLAYDIIISAGAHPSFLGHEGYTASICASVNDELVHGIPNDRPLVEGDVVSIDVGAYLDGFHGDAAATYTVGVVSPQDIDLIRASKESFEAGLEKVKPGARLGDVSSAIQAHAEGRGYGVIREYGGHGIGRKMWEDPHIPNHGKAGRGPRLQPGMTLAIEPMISIGSPETRVLQDDWTVVMADGKNAAHYEHTVLVTESGARILTTPE